MSSPPDNPPNRIERRRHDRGDLLSTSLLLELTTGAVDPAYVEAAARRAEGGLPPRTRGAWAALLLFVIGVLLVVAVRQTRHTAPQAARLRDDLLQRVDRLTTRTDESGRVLERLRGELAADRDRSLARSASDRSLRDKVRALELDVGATPVSGEGVVVQLADAAGAGEAYAEGRVQDRDLQHVVNALWAAGAEAVAINGQRAGALTAIRQAGESILVDYRPISSPYRVSAIGDRASLSRGFAASPAATRFARLHELYGIGFEIRRADKLELPGAASTRVLVATRAESAPSPTTGAGGQGR